jgi:hypothetical protein
MTDDRERCTGSLQQTMTAESPSPCPVCSALVAVILIDGRPCLVEHAKSRPEALPLALDLW